MPTIDEIVKVGASMFGAGAGQALRERLLELDDRVYSGSRERLKAKVGELEARIKDLEAENERLKDELADLEDDEEGEDE